jgi:predicted nuclease of predicted toxin-antitoxin system
MARWFQADLGIEAVHVEGLGLLNAKDGVIFQSARTADRAVILVTKDDDFRQLIGRHGPPPQVISGSMRQPHAS